MLTPYSVEEKHRKWAVWGCRRAALQAVLGPLQPVSPRADQAGRGAKSLGSTPRGARGRPGHVPTHLCSPAEKIGALWGGGRSDHCVALRDHCQRPGPIRLGRGGRPEVRACAGSALVGLQVTASGHNVPSSGAARGVYGARDKWSYIAFSRSLLAPRRPD